MLHLRRAGLLETRRADRQRHDARRAARRVGNVRTPRAPSRELRATRRRRSRRRDHVAGCCARARTDVDGLLPRRQPRARRLGHQEHGDRSVACSMPTASIARPARRGSSSPSRRRWRRSRTGASRPGDVLVLICRGPMGAGMEETYQLTSALKLSAVRQARRGADRRALQRRLDRRLHRPRLARSARRRPDRQAARWRPRSRSSSTARTLEGSVNLVGEGGVLVGADAGAQILAAGGRAVRSRTRPGSARRHAAVGRAAGRERRHLGRRASTTSTQS